MSNQTFKLLIIKTIKKLYFSSELFKEGTIIEEDKKSRKSFNRNNL